MISEALTEAGVTSKAPIGFDTSKFPHFILPPGFKMPKMKKYSGIEDLRGDLAIFAMDALPYQHDNGLIIYLFFKSLEGEALGWFNMLTTYDLSTFKVVQEKFLLQYGHRIQYEPTMSDLLTERMKPDEEFATFASR